jgi:hypothetical protein
VPVNFTVDELSFDVAPSPHRGFRSRVGRGACEPETYVIFDRSITDKTPFLCIGSPSFCAAQLARKYVAFQPDPVAFHEPSCNLAANAGAQRAARLEINDCATNRDGTAFGLGGSEASPGSPSCALRSDSAIQ